MNRRVLALLCALTACRCTSPLLAHVADPAFVDLPYMAGVAADPAPSLQDQLSHLVTQAGTLSSVDGRTLLPGGTRLVRYEVDDKNIVRIDLTVPETAHLDWLDELRAATIDHVIAGAVMQVRRISGLVVRLQVGNGSPLPINEYYDQSHFSPVDDSVHEESPSRALRALSGSSASPSSAKSITPQPSGALTGVVVFCNAGHGWTATSGSWGLQRPLLNDMNEDHGNIDQLNYLVERLHLAGATVVPFRPVGYQSSEVVLDNDDPGVTYTGPWSNSSATGEYYENGVTLSGVPYRFASTDPTETATARYTPTLPKTDYYPVYCWTRDGTDRVDQVYRIAHTGGATEIKVDHRRVGKGWVWLGNYFFNAGTAGYVEISNASPDPGVVIADAIRFGNGVGDVIGAGPGTVSGFIREEEASRYWAESEVGINAVGMPSSIYDCCSNDVSDDIGTAARWSRAMNRQDVNNDRWRRIYIEYHSNAVGCGGGNCSARGAVGLISASAPTTHQAAFAQRVGVNLENDMLALQDQFEYDWGTRGNTFTSEFGAISTVNNGNEFDATILEVGFHDNVADAALMRDPRVRDAMARSTVHSIIEQLSNTTLYPGTQVPDIKPPEPLDKASAVRLPNGLVRIRWGTSRSGGTYGDSPTGIRVYRSSDGKGFGQPVVAVHPSFLDLDLPTGEVTYLRIVTFNDGGESRPTPVLAVRPAASGDQRVLILDDFDRLDRAQNPSQHLPGRGPADRPVARWINNRDAVVPHAAALHAAGVSFDSAATINAIQFQGYDAVVWICGESMKVDFLTGLFRHSLDVVEQNAIQNFLGGGGSLFLSGAEIGFELVGKGVGPNFIQDVLNGVYVGNDADTFAVQGAGGVMAGVGSFDFNPANGAPYLVEAPDRIEPDAGATSIFGYVGGTGGSAGIQYDSGLYRAIMLGFPFETITSASARAAIMDRAMEFLLPGGAPGDFDGDGDVDQSDFGHLQACLSGAGVPQADPNCFNARFDNDGDVDADDIAIFLTFASRSDIRAGQD